MANKIDSNVTGLRIADEATLGVLIGSPIWRPREPNSYSDFGGQITTVARAPINPSRQRRKGVVTDLDASAGWSEDLTTMDLTRFLQGFFFAAAREKADTAPLNGAGITITQVDGAAEGYEAASGLTIFRVGDLILASGFNTAANNGLKRATTVIGTEVTVAENLTTETPPAGASIQHVGFQFGTGEINIDATVSALPKLVRASGTKDLTQFGLIPGEWIYIGGDAVGERFTATAINGFARVSAVSTSDITFDKTAGIMVDETGTGKTIRIFFGKVLKNESDPALIVRRSYQLERTLGADADGTMSEYVTGAVSNQIVVNVPRADKVTMDLSYVGIDHEQRTGLTGVKTGTRPALSNVAAFNTSSDFTRIKMGLVSAIDSAPTSLFAFLTELTLTLNNNVRPSKAIAVLGAFDTVAGDFQVDGSVTAYFADVTAVAAVRNNSDVTIDMALAKGNKGLVLDIPLLTLGEGRVNVTKDQEVTLPLSLGAAESTIGHTLLYNEFPYLPSIAEA